MIEEQGQSESCLRIRASSTTTNKPKLIIRFARSNQLGFSFFSPLMPAVQAAIVNVTDLTDQITDTVSIVTTELNLEQSGAVNVLFFRLYGSMDFTANPQIIMRLPVAPRRLMGITVPRLNGGCVIITLDSNGVVKLWDQGIGPATVDYFAMFTFMSS